MKNGGHFYIRKGRRIRIRGLIRKEFLQIVRDPSSIAIAFLMPVFLLLIHGYGVSLNARHVPMAIVVEKPDAATAALIGAFESSSYFRVLRCRSMPEAVSAMRWHRAEGIIRLRTDFSQKLFETDSAAPIQLIINGVDANTARLVSGYVEGTWSNWLQDRIRDSGGQGGLPIRFEERIWFNREVSSRNFLVPGLIAVNMTLIGALLTAMVMAREWDRGTMEALMATPVSMVEILLGKLVPYFVMGMGGMSLSVAMAFWLFEVPFRGSLWVLAGVSAIFLLAALGMGLLISITTKNQFTAGQTAIIVTFLPAFLLSGFIFEISSMPEAIQAVTYAVAAKYFVAVLQSVFLSGDIWPVIIPNTLALAAMAAMLLGLCVVKSKKRLG